MEAVPSFQNNPQGKKKMKPMKIKHGNGRMARARTEKAKRHIIPSLKVDSQHSAPRFGAVRVRYARWRAINMGTRVVGTATLNWMEDRHIRFDQRLWPLRKTVDSQRDSFNYFVYRFSFQGKKFNYCCENCVSVEQSMIQINDCLLFRLWRPLARLN